MTLGLYWLIYDIRCDRERRRVEKCAERYGQRLQKSVFACVLNGDRRSRLLAELEGLGCASGSVLLAELAKPPRLASVGSGACVQEDWAFVSHPLALPSPPGVLGEASAEE